MYFYHDLDAFRKNNFEVQALQDGRTKPIGGSSTAKIKQLCFTLTHMQLLCDAQTWSSIWAQFFQPHSGLYIQTNTMRTDAHARFDGNAANFSVGQSTEILANSNRFVTTKSEKIRFWSFRAKYRNTCKGLWAHQSIRRRMETASECTFIFHLSFFFSFK